MSRDVRLTLFFAVRWMSGFTAARTGSSAIRLLRMSLASNGPSHFRRRSPGISDQRSTARAVDFVFRAALLVLREALRWPVALTAQAYPTHDLATNP